MSVASLAEQIKQLRATRILSDVVCKQSPTNRKTVPRREVRVELEVQAIADEHRETASADAANTNQVSTIEPDKSFFDKPSAVVAPDDSPDTDATELEEWRNWRFPQRQLTLF